MALSEEKTSLLGIQMLVGLSSPWRHSNSCMCYRCPVLCMCWNWQGYHLVPLSAAEGTFFMAIPFKCWWLKHGWKSQSFFSVQKGGKAEGDMVPWIVVPMSWSLIIFSRASFWPGEKGITLLAWGCTSGINLIEKSYLHCRGRTWHLLIWWKFEGTNDVGVAPVFWLSWLAPSLPSWMIVMLKWTRNVSLRLFLWKIHSGEKQACQLTSRQKKVESKKAKEATDFVTNTVDGYNWVREWFSDFKCIIDQLWGSRMGGV